MKPLVTIALMFYNQEEFVRDAIQAAMKQTYSPLEIFISDDESSDMTWENIQEVTKGYSGQHSLVKNRNAANMGINAHVNKIMQMASGDFIVIAGGDDISTADRVEKLVDVWLSGASGVFSNATLIDQNGQEKKLMVQPGYKHMKSWREMIVAGTHGSWGCSLAWDKRVFEVFGPMPENILGEDAVIPFRAALMGGMSYVDAPLVFYREHADNVSFWVKEKGLEKNERIEMGLKFMGLKKQMSLNWKQDVELAASAGLISDSDLDWANSVLNINLLLFQKAAGLMKSPLLLVIAVIPFYIMLFSFRLSKYVPLRLAFNRSVLNVLNGIMRFRLPLLHRTIRNFLGRNT